MAQGEPFSRGVIGSLVKGVGHEGKGIVLLSKEKKRKASVLWLNRGGILPQAL